MNKVAELKRKYKLVDLLGVSRQVVSEWRYLPPLRAIQIEYMTDGEFRAIDLIDPKAVRKWK